MLLRTMEVSSRWSLRNFILEADEQGNKGKHCRASKWHLCEHFSAGLHLRHVQLLSQLDNLPY